MGYDIDIHIVPFERYSEDTYRFSSNEDRDLFFTNNILESVKDVTINFQNNGLVFINLVLNLDIDYLEIMKYNYLRLRNTVSNTRYLYYFINNIDFISNSQYRLQCSIDTIMTYFYDIDNVNFYDSIINRSHIDRFKNKDLDFKINDSRLFNNEFTYQKVLKEVIEVDNSQLELVYIFNNPELSGGDRPITIYGGVGSNLFMCYLETPDLYQYVMSKWSSFLVAVTFIPKKCINSVSVSELVHRNDNGNIEDRLTVNIVNQVLPIDVNLPKLKGKYKIEFTYENEPKIYLGNIQHYSIGFVGILNHEIPLLTSGDVVQINYTNINGQSNISMTLINGVNSEPFIINEVLDTNLPLVSNARNEYISSNANAYKQNVELPNARAWSDTSLNSLSSLSTVGIGLQTGGLTGNMMQAKGLASSSNSMFNFAETALNNNRRKQDYALHMDNLSKSPNAIKNSGNTFINVIQKYSTRTSYGWDLKIQIYHYSALKQDILNVAHYYNRMGYMLAENGLPRDYIYSRSRFNFLQCELGTITGVTNDIKLDIRNRLSNGVRFWEVSEVVGDYSIENYERSIL